MTTSGAARAVPGGAVPARAATAGAVPSDAVSRPARAGRAGLALLLALLAALAATLALAGPAAAQERLISITAEGVSPKVLRLAAGDTVTFVNDDQTFSYRAQSTSDNWSCDSGPVGLLPGRTFSCPDPFTESGTYTYMVAQDEPFRGSIVLPKPGTPPAQATPRPAANTGPSPAATAPTSPGATPTPSPTGGTGVARPPVTGGFDSLGIPSTPAPEGTGPAPDVAPPPDADVASGDDPAVAPDPSQDPAVAGAPDAAASVQPAVAASLPGASSSRGLGLPAALAVVLAVGVVSLLVRLLLAEPAGRRAAAGPVAAVD